MKSAYRLFRRDTIYYLEDSRTGKRESLGTTRREDAQRLWTAKIEAARHPLLNLALAKTYLAAQDPQLVIRTWSEVMEAICTKGRPSSQERCRRAMASKDFASVRRKKLVETTADDLLTVLTRGGVATQLYLRTLHNFALGVGWIVAPILHTKLWPKLRYRPKRGITLDEHSRILAAEGNQERRLYYGFLWETGAAQSDAANMTHENINWQAGSLVYQRRKLKENSQPARLAIGAGLEVILRQLPRSGFLFPKLAGLQAVHRASEFSRRCKLLQILGITLHSYRYAWAERAVIAGYPERWARFALGHRSSAVHAAYAKGAQLICPALDSYVAPQPTGQFSDYLKEKAM